MDTTIDRKDEKDNLDCAYDTSDSVRAKLKNNTFGEDTGQLVSDDGTRSKFRLPFAKDRNKHFVHWNGFSGQVLIAKEMFNHILTLKHRSEFMPWLEPFWGRTHLSVFSLTTAVWIRRSFGSRVSSNSPAASEISSKELSWHQRRGTGARRHRLDLQSGHIGSVPNWKSMFEWSDSDSGQVLGKCLILHFLCVFCSD